MPTNPAKSDLICNGNIQIQRAENFVRGGDKSVRGGGLKNFGMGGAGLHGGGVPPSPPYWAALTAAIPSVIIDS